MNNKGFLQLSFQWIFAIIVGIVILFLTIYGIVRFVGTEERTQDLKLSKEFEGLMSPLETGFEGAKSSFIEFPAETRLYNYCDDFGDFGKQGIGISQKSFSKWTTPSRSSDIYNKYIFSEYILEGRKVNLFSKPFEFPFKVGNLIYLIPATKIYCFDNSPENIETELENLNIANIKTRNCLQGEIKVCFEGGEDCNVKVSYDQKFIEKRGNKTYFEGDALMYAGIFADNEIYECQLKRLMKRVSSLADLSIEKANFIATLGCNTVLNTDLGLLSSRCKEISSSRELSNIKSLADNIDSINSNNAVCKLW